MRRRRPAGRGRSGERSAARRSRSCLSRAAPARTGDRPRCVRRAPSSPRASRPGRARRPSGELRGEERLRGAGSGGRRARSERANRSRAFCCALVSYGPAGMSARGGASASAACVSRSVSSGFTSSSCSIAPALLPVAGSITPSPRSSLCCCTGKRNRCAGYRVPRDARARRSPPHPRSAPPESARAWRRTPTSPASPPAGGSRGAAPQAFRRARAAAARRRSRSSSSSTASSFGSRASGGSTPRRSRSPTPPLPRPSARAATRAAAKSTRSPPRCRR